jgi:hypothetical protein
MRLVGFDLRATRTAPTTRSPDAQSATTTSERHGVRRADNPIDLVPTAFVLPRYPMDASGRSAPSACREGANHLE